MSASRCTHWLDLHGTTFDCDLTLGHGGKRLVGAENAAREESKGHLIRTWKRTSTALPAHVCEVSAA